MEEKVAGLLSNEQHATLSQLIVSYRKSAVSHALATNGRGSSLRSPSSLYDDMQQAETALSTYLTELQQTEVPKSALITTEVSLRFKLDCEKVKSKNLEDEVRELKERFNRMRLLRDEYAVVAAAANRYLASTEPTNSITTQQEVEAAKVEAVVSRDALMSALQNLN